MSVYYPVLLDLKGRKCLVIGGGIVAERKIKPLVKAKAMVTVISLEITVSLKQMAEKKKIHFINDHFRERYLKGAFLVVGATNNPEVNHHIFQAATKADKLVNIVDSPAECNFLVPSTVRQGDLSISISTGGKSPALAKKMRKELEIQFGKPYRDFLVLMGKLRPRVLDKFSGAKYRNKIFQALVDSDLLILFKKGLKDKAEIKAEQIINDFSLRTRGKS